MSSFPVGLFPEATPAMMKLKTSICKAFSAAAKDYETVAFVQKEIGERMMERLAYLVMKSNIVLDLGCGTGLFTQQLQQTYPEAQVIGVDSSLGMLSQAQLKQPLLFLPADMHNLPFDKNSVDLIFANQAIHWSLDLKALFKEMHRVLKPGGCLFFSTLGPDTFLELRDAWARSDYFEHVSPFADMHLVGDNLMSTRFLDPVVDREDLTVHYPSLITLIQSLKSQGVRNIHPNRNPGLTSKTSWKKFQDAYHKKWLTPEGKAQLRYEIIYGHAWKGLPRVKQKNNEILISVESLKSL